jgi:hypothetical protein
MEKPLILTFGRRRRLVGRGRAAPVADNPPLFAEKSNPKRRLTGEIALG